MSEKNVHTDRVTGALETASVLRMAVFSIDSLEDALAGTAHVHQLGDLRRAVQASARRIDDLAEDLDKIDSQYSGTARA